MIVKVTFAPAARIEPAPSLFAPGMPWLRAAEEWATAQGLQIARHTVNQRVQVGEAWYAVTWQDDSERWLILPE